MKQINTMAFRFKLPNSMKIHLVFHVSLLEPNHVSTILGRTHEPPSPIIVDDEQKYEVEEISDLRISHHQLQYLIHWQGYDINKHTWNQSRTYQMPWKK